MKNRHELDVYYDDEKNKLEENRYRYFQNLSSIRNELDKKGFSNFVNEIAERRINSNNFTMMSRSLITVLFNYYICMMDLPSQNSIYLPQCNWRPGHLVKWTHSEKLVDPLPNDFFYAMVVSIYAGWKYSGEYRTFSYAQMDISRREEERLAQAQNQAQQIIAQARNEAHQIKIDAEADAKSSADRLIVKYLLNDRAKSLSDPFAYDNVYSTLQSTKKDMIDGTDELKREWRKGVSDAIENMKNIQNNLEDKLRKWQVSLYHQELVPLAQCYGQIYRTFTMNKILIDEIMACDSSKADNNNNGYSNPTLEKLRKLDNSLYGFIQSYVKAIKSFGLYVYTPEAGTVFDDVRHVSDTDGIDVSDSAVIKACITPGIEQRTNEHDEGTPIVRAVVSVESGRENKGQ